MNDKELNTIINRVTKNNKIALKRKGPESTWLCETCKLSGKQCARRAGHCDNGCYQPIKNKTH